MKTILIASVLSVALISCRSTNGEREVISLNGKWEIAMSGTSGPEPQKYTSEIVVPGLIDMAYPALENQDSIYENKVYWYRRTIPSAGNKREVIILKINKSRYHTKVWVNGQFAGENYYSFTPSYFSIKQFLKKSGQNELVISVGSKNNLPDTVTNGWDFEKIKYIPGIYDDVSLICTDYPYINNIQAVPDVKNGRLRVVAEIVSGGSRRTRLDYQVIESVTQKTEASGTVRTDSPGDGNMRVADFTVEMQGARLWSPEDPFLYDLRIKTSGDSRSVRFGMRSFEASPDSGIFLLNGKPYYMRGTNVCIYRFFEDPDRGNLPWDSEWVAKLHARFREMHWTGIRYCIGFPPERWYEIADSIGFLIQDEYPLWTLGRENFRKYLGRLNSDQLASEYREWMRERWNHPSVVIWDAQNESVTDTTAKAIEKVRGLDLSNRPWDNGWAAPVSSTDAIESHPYLFSRYQARRPGPEGYMKEIFSEVRIPGNDPNTHAPLPGGKRYGNPIILNEYGWIWLNRNGTTTTLTDKVYENVWPWADTPAERLEIYGKTLGMLTEYWRGHRKAAAVFHFCGLGYSRPDKPRGQTSDHFINIRELTFEPSFYKYVRPAFFPLGLMVEFWEMNVRPGSEHDIRINLINDTYEKVLTNLLLEMRRGEELVRTDSATVSVGPLGRIIRTFPVTMPVVPGKYSLQASIEYKGEKIISSREFEVK